MLNDDDDFLHQPAFSRQASALGKQTAEIKVCCDDNLKTWVSLHAAKFGMSSSEYVRNLLWKERGGYTYDEAIEQLERHNRQLRAQAFAAPLPIEGGNGADVTPLAPFLRRGQE